MSKILISIVVPIYNVEKYIDRCIESVVGYQGEDVEVILVDDGSTDESRAYCQKWVDKDSRIILTPEKENGGLADARNYGMTYCRGEWILFIDSDDYLEENAILELRRYALQSKDAEAVIVFDYYDVSLQYDEKSRSFGLEDKCISGEEACRRMLEGKIPTSAWSKLVRRSVYIENNILFPKGRRYEDTIVTWRIFRRTEKVKMVSRTIYNYVQQSESITANPVVKDAEDTIQNLKEIHEDIYGDSSYQGIYSSYCCRALTYAYQMCICAVERDKVTERKIKELFKKSYGQADIAWLKKQNDYYKIQLMHCGCFKMAIKLKRRLCK